ncbi:hypothetical protein SDC9_122950 [bioreactor metagenome]|uniref:Uncharacterized protein n=1 Tax=bioreactor metagenome TaxID=1076179 RepID=A0A645CGB7_9ZZZZ
MSEEAFVIFVNIITDDSLLTTSVVQNRFPETINYLFKYGVIENEFLPVHNSLHVCLGK